MKKKKIISILSSILCSFAFVGLFAIGLFVDYKQKANETKAEDEVVYVEEEGELTYFSANLSVGYSYRFVAEEYSADTYVTFVTKNFRNYSFDSDYGVTNASSVRINLSNDSYVVVFSQNDTTISVPISDVNYFEFDCGSTTNASHIQGGFYNIRYVLKIGNYNGSLLSTYDSNLTFYYDYNYCYFKRLYNDFYYYGLDLSMNNAYVTRIVGNEEETITFLGSSQSHYVTGNSFQPIYSYRVFLSVYYSASYVNYELYENSNGFGFSLSVTPTGINSVYSMYGIDYLITHTPIELIETFSQEMLPHTLISVVQNYEDSPGGSYEAGYVDGYDAGLEVGQTSSTTTSYNVGYENGVQAGIEYQSSVDATLIEEAHNSGFVEGYELGHNEDATVSSIFSGITTVALVPIKFFLSVFNFEILGVNIASVVSALMSICLILIIWRTLMGGKSND